MNLAIDKQKQEDELLGEAKVFREQERLRAQYDVEKDRLVSYIISYGLVYIVACQGGGVSNELPDL